MHAAYVLLVALHACRLHICGAYEYMHAACEHKLVLRAPRFSAYVQHTSACMWICVTRISTLEFGQKMRAACVQHFVRVAYYISENFCVTYKKFFVAERAHCIQGYQVHKQIWDIPVGKVFAFEQHYKV